MKYKKMLYLYMNQNSNYIFSYLSHVLCESVELISLLLFCLLYFKIIKLSKKVKRNCSKLSKVALKV